MRTEKQIKSEAGQREEERLNPEDLMEARDPTQPNQEVDRRSPKHHTDPLMHQPHLMQVPRRRNQDFREDGQRTIGFRGPGH